MLRLNPGKPPKEARRLRKKLGAAGMGSQPSREASTSWFEVETMQSQEGIPSLKRRKCTEPAFWNLSLYQKTSMPCHVILKLGRWKQEDSLGLRVTSLAKPLRDSGSKNNLENTLDFGPWPLPVWAECVHVHARPPQESSSQELRGTSLQIILGWLTTTDLYPNA